MRTEFRKLATLRGTWFVLAAGLLLVVAGVSGLMSHRTLVNSELTSKAVAHVGLVSLLSLVLGILATAGEYRNRTIAETFLATPRRGRVLAAKTVAAVSTAVGFALAASVVALAATAIWLRDDGGLHLDDAGLWKTIGGDIAWNALFALIGVAVGAAVRNLTGAIAAALAWIAVVEGIVGQLLGDSLARWLPFRAGTALGRVTLVGSLGQGTAAAVLVGYAAVLSVAGYLVTVRRDVES